MDTLSEKSEYKYSCEWCDYNTSGNYDYIKHLLTLKPKHNYTFYTLSEKSECKSYK
jgi:hypothetical protein